MDISAIHVGQIALAQSLAKSVAFRGGPMGTPPPSRQRPRWLNGDIGLFNFVRNVLRASSVSGSSATRLNDLNAGKCKSYADRVGSSALGVSSSLRSTLRAEQTSNFIETSIGTRRRNDRRNSLNDRH
jgi:hypothetical protein